MPLEFLRQIAGQGLPCKVYAPAQIDKLRVLQAAGLVTAVIPPVEEIPGGRKIHRPAQALAITDNGIGFPAGVRAQETQAHGRGLDNMRARATAIGASFDVQQSPDGGVSIALEWQVERAPPSSGFHDNPGHG